MMPYWYNFSMESACTEEHPGTIAASGLGMFSLIDEMSLYVPRFGLVPALGLVFVAVRGECL